MVLKPTEDVVLPRAVRLVHREQLAEVVVQAADSPQFVQIMQFPDMI